MTALSEDARPATPLVEATQQAKAAAPAAGAVAIDRTAKM